MKEIIQVAVFVSRDLVINREVRYLLGIHARSWDLDWSCKVEVVVAQVVGRGLNLVIGESSRVVHDFKVNRLNSSNSGFVRD